MEWEAWGCLNQRENGDTDTVAPTLPSYLSFIPPPTTQGREGGGSHKCEYCNRVFTSFSNKERHMPMSTCMFIRDQQVVHVKEQQVVHVKEQPVEGSGVKGGGLRGESR